jgi:hypothetical protein
MNRRPNRFRFLRFRDFARFAVLAACLGASLGVPRADDAKPGPPAYTPQISDFMTETQLRHFKLRFAGSLKNWALAEYELDKMKTSFAQAERYAGADAGPFSQSVKAMSDPAFQALAEAISAKDSARFIKGFRQLTAACNACHESFHVGFIKVQTPTASPFSDQAFSP